MNTTTHDVDAAGRRYLDEAEANLADLPARDRGELVSDIADAIAELGADAAADYDLLVARLGSPEEFAREIRRSAGGAGAAGIDEPALEATTPLRPVASSAHRAEPVVEPVAAVSPATTDTPGFVAMVGAALQWIGSEFEAVWWFLRAFLVAIVVAGVVGSVGVGIAFGIVALALSLARGIYVRRRRGAAEAASVRGIRGAATVIAGVLALGIIGVVAVDATSSDYDYAESSAVVTYAESDSPTGGLVGVNGPIENVYAFDAKGNRIDNVRLYDQNGAPIEIGAGVIDPDRKVDVVGRDGELAFNGFPIRYYEPDTAVVANPDAGWPESPGPVLGERRGDGLPAATTATMSPEAVTPGATAATPMAPVAPSSTEAAPAKPVDPVASTGDAARAAALAAQ